MDKKKSEPVSAAVAVETLRGSIAVESTHKAQSEARESELDQLLGSGHEALFVNGKLNSKIATDITQLENEKRVSDLILQSLARQKSELGPIVAAEVQRLADEIQELHTQNLAILRASLGDKLRDHFEPGPALINAINSSRVVREHQRLIQDNSPASTNWWIQAAGGALVIDTAISARRIVEAFDTNTRILADIQKLTTELRKKNKQ